MFVEMYYAMNRLNFQTQQDWLTRLRPKGFYGDLCIFNKYLRAFYRCLSNVSSKCLSSTYPDICIFYASDPVIHASPQGESCHGDRIHWWGLLT